MKKTKIIATIWPATWNEEKILALYQQGVNVIRCNFSHAKYEDMARVVEMVKGLNAAGKTKLGLMLDTKWPELRTGDLPEPRQFHAGERFTIGVIGQTTGEECALMCDYQCLLESVNVGDTLRIDSGLFDVVVQEKWTTSIVVEAKNDALIGSRRHVNLPGIAIKLPGLIDKDKEDIRFGVEQGYDMIAMSFVRSALHVEELRTFLEELKASHIQIIAKIENQEGIEHMDEIIQAADGVMVARGDLGIEVPIQKLPVYQQQILQTARKYGKCSIVATHLLESMIEHPFPTRAEVSDIFNAVQQQTDAVMLSAETATGHFPIEAVKIMKQVIAPAEENVHYSHVDFTPRNATSRDLEKQQLIKNALYLSEDLDAKAVIVFTKSGKLARYAAAYRPQVRVYAVTNTPTTVTGLSCRFAVLPRFLPYTSHVEALAATLEMLKSSQQIVSGERVIAVTDILRDGEEIPVVEIVTVP